MFPYPIARPQGCDIQTFYGISESKNSDAKSWNKPVGVSHVYMMLIAGGVSGDGTGGGSGAVTVWYGAAQHVPNSLVVWAANTNQDSEIYYRNNGLRTLLTAKTGSANIGGVATTAGPFAASGFYKSTAGQDGSAANITASTTTFLSGGAGGTSSTVTANYGYSLSSSTTDLNGTFQMQPIIVGLAGKSNGVTGLGCGGGSLGLGGPGMVLIASW